MELLHFIIILLCTITVQSIDMNQLYQRPIQNQANKIRGFDCGSPNKITTLSLINVGDCNITDDNVTTHSAKVHLLQRLDYQNVDVIQCKINVFRRAFYCGKNYFTYHVNGEDANYLSKVSREECQKLHKTGELEFRKQVFIKGKLNATVSNNVIFAGTFDKDNWCDGAAFTDPYGSWKSNIVATGVVQVTLQSTRLRVHLSSEKVILPSGQQCDYKKSECEDTFAGHTFWETLDKSKCNCCEFGVVFKGTADKVQGNKKTIYRVTNEDMTFALAVTKSTQMCDRNIYETEHPRLLIYEDIDGDIKEIGSQMNVLENMDMLAYVNSKFIYYDYNIRKQLDTLYYDILHKQCELERKVLENFLTIALKSPSEFAYRLMKGPGYTGVISGEVIHVVECIPVEVAVKPTEKCYIELPVSYQDMPLFLTPITHILVQYGTEVPCNDFLPTMYQLNNNWYKFNPNAASMFGGAPEILKPNTSVTWKYESPRYLAESGIYSNNDLERLRGRIMDGQETPAIVNEIIKGATGGGAPDSRLTIWKLLENEYDMLNPFTWFWHKAVEFVTKVGSICAALYGLFIICHILKAIIHLIINAFALDSLGGAVGHIFKAIGVSVTYLFRGLFTGPTVLTKHEKKLMMKRKQKNNNEIKLNNLSNGKTEVEIEADVDEEADEEYELITLDEGKKVKKNNVNHVNHVNHIVRNGSKHHGNHWKDGKNNHVQVHRMKKTIYHDDDCDDNVFNV